jgi:small subunit ribosomal protein S1
MKQLVPTGLDEYLAEHKQGDVVTGRVVDISGDSARVELGEGIRAHCRIAKDIADSNGGPTSPGKADLSSLTSMLQARWKSGANPQASKSEAVQVGQVRKFRIAKLDVPGKQIALELA